ncbi:Translocation protein sec72 [Lasiodiplodia hormozganensis]|uniref:Translocation protein sec72 n=1 Tax=Lasiodiplodia hormozganensis TaxID=869390 RepID=A0AA39WG67_9PEZI|nr:Translocation protein sec72 [Lasiodiplodia hormozganensis]
MEEETYTQLPLHMDPQTKAISAHNVPAAVQRELEELNQLHRQFLTLETPGQTPPPPVPVNPKRSAGITKLREAGNAAFKKGQYAEAAKCYTMAIELAAGRPPWEPSGLVREELSGLYANRAQAYMSLQDWASGAVDAETSVDLKRVQNAKAWWRRGRCLLEMGRAKEARDWVIQAREFEPNEADLQTLAKDIDAAIEKGKSD